MLLLNKICLNFTKIFTYLKYDVIKRNLNYISYKLYNNHNIHQHHTIYNCKILIFHYDSYKLSIIFKFKFNLNKLILNN